MHQIAHLVPAVAPQLRPDRSRRPEYSLMDVFARYDFDVWTIGFEGYGRVDASAALLRPARPGGRAVMRAIFAENGFRIFGYDPITSRRGR